jgi:DNA-binding response OmpR family regulator
LVEDDPVVRKLVKTYLERMALFVIEAADGRSALKQLTEMVPDLVCLDLVLPESSGYEVCEFIRRLPALRDVPVMVMSARALPEDRAHAVEVGASAYLIKPFTQHEFTNQVDILLRSAATRRIPTEAGMRQRRRRRVTDLPAKINPLSYRQLRNYFGYAAGALARRKFTATAVFALVALATVGSVFVWPKRYFAEARIWAEGSELASRLATPGLPPPEAATPPTRSAPETVLRRDNLVALIDQTDLMDNWDLSRVPILRLKDRLTSLVRGRPTKDDKMNALVGMLEKQLKVGTGEGIVTISIIWPDLTLAFRLAEAAEQNFLEARYVSEISNIVETISILEGHARGMRDSIEASLDEIHRVRAARDVGPAAEVKPSLPTEPLNPELAQIKVLLTAKRQAISDVQGFRQRRLAEFQTQLLDQQSRYPSTHPVLVNLRQSIKALLQDSTHLASMKKEEQELFADYRKRGGDIGTLAVDWPLKPLDSMKVKRELLDAGDDPSLEYARARLNNSLSKYDLLMAQIDGAKIGLDAARAAFQRRYKVISPVQVPKQAVTPEVPLILIAGFVAALVLAIGFAIAVDVKAGRIFERWQIEQQLALPILSQVRRP